jgi:hypothetical protein
MRTGFLFRAAFAAASATLAVAACGGSGDTGNLFIDGGSTGNGGGPGGGSDGSVNGIPPGQDGGGPGPGFDGGGGGGDGSAGKDGGGFVGGCHPNPANAEIPDNGCDDDADGKTDNVVSCDTSLTIDGDATAFAHAIGICDDASSRGFGVLSASFTRGHGAAAVGLVQQHGILPKFGSKLVPREGASLGVLSSGYAHEFDDDSAGTAPFAQGVDLTMTYPGSGAAPPGFPKAAANCPVPGAVTDVIVLKLVLKTPPNAIGFSFDHDFYASDWPVFTCDQFSDEFVAYLSAAGFNGGAEDNIAFDPGGNPISVNMSYLDRCTPGAYVGCEQTPGTGTSVSKCAGGVSELAGTGYGLTAAGCGYPAPDGGVDPDAAAPPDPSNGAAGGWLTTVAPVNPGETFTLELMIWDSADGVNDSSILLDHFHWIDTKVNASTTRAK